jgi:hypothetical protein
MRFNLDVIDRLSTKLIGTALTMLLLSQTSHGAAGPSYDQIPDEFESTAGNSLGFGNAGVAASAGLSSVRMNPAMLPLEKQYRVSAGYHWPTAGREYYQAGVVDSSSSRYAAGVVYTSSQDDYQEYSREGSEARGASLSGNDSPVKKRISLGLGTIIGSISLGIGGQRVEAWDLNSVEKKTTIKGTTLGIGAAGLISQQLRFSVSIENMANESVRDYAPKMYRAGLAYLVGGGKLSFHIDYRDRERVAQEIEGAQDFPDIFAADDQSQQRSSGQINSEKMVTGSFSVRVQNMLRVLGAAGREVGGGTRTNLSGGVALVNKNFTFSYMVSRPYFLRDDSLHQAINMGIDVSI